MGNKTTQTTYRVVFDIYATSDKYLLECETYEQARRYELRYNLNERLTREYGKVHIEKVTLTKEVID